MSPDQLWEATVSDSRFVPGVAGTAISIGCLGDPLAPQAVQATIRLLTLAATSRNPVQVSTRWVPSRGTVDGLIEALVASRAVMFNSFATLTQKQVFEPRTPGLSKRVAFLQQVFDAGIDGVMYIKPVLAGVTDVDAEAMAELAIRSGFGVAVVGGLWAPDPIRADLESRGVAVAAGPLLSGHPALSGTIDIEGSYRSVDVVTDALTARGVAVHRHSTDALALLRGTRIDAPAAS